MSLVNKVKKGKQKGCNNVTCKVDFEFNISLKGGF